MEVLVPITEQSHPASKNMDGFSAKEIASLMMREDDIFGGWNGSSGILDEDLLQSIAEIQKVLTIILQDPQKNAVVLSGCGTSGRIAFMMSRTLNLRWRSMKMKPCFEYLIAGHDIAFLTSQESPEDDPIVGRQMLEEVCKGKSRVLFIGITCGLSAPFVAGQLDYCFSRLDVFTPVLIGFNTVDMARNVSIENWDQTFLQVARRMESLHEEGKGYILNPIIGPELITGSTRMKGGSATKLLLEVIFKGTLQEAPQSIDTLRHEFNTYRQALYAVHESGNDEIIGRIISLGATCLGNEGHIYYMGDEHLGLVALIDASECPPTYGTAVEDVRGFINGGFQMLGNKEGDLSSQFQISMSYFESNILPHVCQKDLLVVIAKDGDLSTIPSLKDLHCQKVLVDVCTINAKNCRKKHDSFQEELKIDLSNCMESMPSEGGDFTKRALVEIAAKWFCNSLTTGAHVLVGKVFGNFMIDVQVRNNKLFHRAIRIIKRFVQCSEAEARSLLLRAIYSREAIDGCWEEMPVSEHIEVATKKEKVVPVALILGLSRCSVAQAAEILKKKPVVRQALAACTVP